MMYWKSLREPHDMSATTVILSKIGQHDKAVGLSREALNIYTQLLGQKHLVTLDSMKDLSFCLHRQGNINEAQDLRLQALGSLENLLGPTHRTVCIGMLNLSAYHQEQKLHKRAKITCRKTYFLQ